MTLQAFDFPDQSPAGTDHVPAPFAAYAGPVEAQRRGTPADRRGAPVAPLDQMFAYYEG